MFWVGVEGVCVQSLEGEKRGERRKIIEEREEKGEKRGGKRRERKEKREKRKGKKRGEWVPHVTWTPHQHLIVILISFDNFNGLSYDKG